MHEYDIDNREMNLQLMEAMSNRIDTLNNDIKCKTEFIKIKKSYDVYLKEISNSLPDSKKELFDKLDNCLKDMFLFYKLYLNP